MWKLQNLDKNINNETINHKTRQSLTIKIRFLIQCMREILMKGWRKAKISRLIEFGVKKNITKKEDS